MTTKLVSLRIEDGVALVRMQDEIGKNSFHSEFLAALRSAFDEAVRDERSRVVFLAGLPDIFSSGAPLELLRKLCEEVVEPSELNLPAELLSLPLPVVSAMRGHAVGGGLALGLCADLTVIAKESRYAANFMDLGFTPGMGMTGLLEHVLPPALATEMLFTGRSYRGSFFDARSGFNRIVGKGRVEEEAWDIALQVAEKPRHALELLKDTLAKRRRHRYEQDFAKERLMHELCFRHPETIRRIKANYVE